MTRQKKPPEMVKKHQRTGSKKVRPRETNLLFGSVVAPEMQPKHSKTFGTERSYEVHLEV